MLMAIEVRPERNFARPFLTMLSELKLSACVRELELKPLCLPQGGALWYSYPGPERWSGPIRQVKAATIPSSNLSAHPIPIGMPPLARLKTMSLRAGLGLLAATLPTQCKAVRIDLTCTSFPEGLLTPSFAGPIFSVAPVPPLPAKLCPVILNPQRRSSRYDIAPGFGNGQHNEQGPP